MTIEETMAAANKVAAINVLTGIFNIVNQWDEQQREIERLREELDDLKAEDGGARRPGPVERAIRDEFSKPRHGKFWTATSIDPWFDRTRERLGIEHDPDQCHLVDLIGALLDELDDPKTKAEEPREVTEDDLPEELRKRLMPEGMEWPRFESGELVRFGDEYIDCDGKAATAKAVKFYDSCLFALFDKNRDGTFYAWRDRVNRPEPHGLLGTDGEPIKAGETVYGRFDGKEWRVIGFDLVKPDCPVRAIDEDGSVRNFYPKWFTHERPSNGDAKPPETAEKPSPNGDGCPDSGMDGGFATEASRESDSVESDSWKRMCLDASASGSVYCLFYGISYKDVADARKKQIEDLERRAKKLSGVAE